MEPDHQDSGTPDDESRQPPDEVSGDAADEAGAPGGGGDAAGTVDPAEAAARFAEHVRRSNAEVEGRLTLHYRSRDVAVMTDGASAMRIIATWQQRPAFPPRLNPKWSSARFEWLGIDLDELMGCLWEPDLSPDSGVVPERITLDPAR